MSSTFLRCFLLFLLAQSPPLSYLYASITKHTVAAVEAAAAASVQKKSSDVIKLQRHPTASRPQITRKPVNLVPPRSSLTSQLEEAQKKLELMTIEANKTSRKLGRIQRRRSDDRLALRKMSNEMIQEKVDLAQALVETQTGFVAFPSPYGIEIYPAQRIQTQSFLYSALEHQRHMEEELSKLTRPDSNSSNSLSSLDAPLPIATPPVSRISPSAPIDIPPRSNRGQTSVHKASY